MVPSIRSCEATSCIRAMRVVRIDCGVCDLAPLSVNRGVDRLVQRRGQERRQALPARSARVAEWPFCEAYPAVAFGGRDWILIPQLCDLVNIKEANSEPIRQAQKLWPSSPADPLPTPFWDTEFPLSPGSPESHPRT